MLTCNLNEHEKRVINGTNFNCNEFLLQSMALTKQLQSVCNK